MAHYHHKITMVRKGKVTTENSSIGEVKIDIRFYVFLTIVFYSSSCSKRNEIRKYPDPFQDVFIGKNVKLIVAYDANDSSGLDSLRNEELALIRWVI